MPVAGRAGLRALLGYARDGLRFIAPELNGLVGEKVQVRYTPHDLRQIEVFRGDRWLPPPTPRTSDRAGRAGYVLTDADRDDYLDWRGNIAALRRARIAAGGHDVPALRTLQRAFARQLTVAERAAVVEGVEGRRLRVVT